MKEITNNELLTISGGFSLSGPILKGVLDIGNFIYNLGKDFGSSLRRINDNKLCPLR